MIRILKPERQSEHRSCVSGRSLERSLQKYENEQMFWGVQTYIPSHEDTFKGKTYTPIMKYNPFLRAQGYSVGPRGRVSRITNLSWDGSPIGNAGTDSACHNRILLHPGPIMH